MSRPLSAEFSKQLGFSFATRLGRNLTLWRNAVLNQDIDCAGVVDGPEGAGKSVLAMQIAYFLDVDNHIDIDKQICYYPEQFKKAIMSLKPGKAIVWDEARRGLNRRRSGENVNLEMTDLLAECRQHNLFLVIVMPSFYDMDMNVAVWRTRYLIHVWYDWDTENIENPLKRGFYRFYSELGKKNLYTNKVFRQRYEYPYIKGKCFDATFPNYYVVDEKAYRTKKRVAEEAYRQGEKKLKPVDLLYGLKERGMLQPGAITEAASVLGVSRMTLHRSKSLPPPAITHNILEERENVS